MSTNITTASPALAQEYSLSQAAYHALIHGFDMALKFNPLQLVMKDSVLLASAPGTSKLDTRILAVIQADYNPLIGQKITLGIAPDKAAIKKAKAIRGGGDVHVSLKGGQYHLHGDHSGSCLKAMPVADAVYFTEPIITWIGSEVAGYDPKNLKEFIGNHSSVQLAVYGDQLEQIGVEGQDAPYTFTAGMAARLVDRRPNLVLKSQVAFRCMGSKQSLRLGKLDGQYVLRVTNPIDMGVDLVVTEHLEIVPGC
ncbi:hypothetical protein GTA51_06520 [Desulfovibrio aerotolerans]|uniref:Uncharacterized protein n=1 Tax=Solidesulfovibrio aerotolerans TaxID=295255 RepID=A0A7C9MIQ5_9BACT|nr:hypothetical protein [Solidesulfovibrio aerotolerans]MYL82789.1 hypothetical protein [Solidesulfovibrio aerotolerans]